MKVKDIMQLAVMNSSIKTVCVNEVFEKEQRFIYNVSTEYIPYLDDKVMATEALEWKMNANNVMHINVRGLKSGA